MRSIVLVVGLMALGCGGVDAKLTASTPPTEVIDPSMDGARTEEIDSVTWGSEVVTFHASYFAGETDPLIVVTQDLNDVQRPDIYGRLMSRSEMVSPAELWLFLTGEKDVPPVLARDHEIQAATWGRGPDYLVPALPLEPLVTEKAQAFDPLGPTIFPAAPSGKCWQNAAGYQENNFRGLGYHSCSMLSRHFPTPQHLNDPGTFLGVGLSITACPESYNEMGWNRHGIMNVSDGAAGHLDQTETFCTGIGNQQFGSWTCQAPRQLSAGFIVDTNDTRFHRVSFTVQNPTIVPTSTNSRIDDWMNGYLVTGSSANNIPGGQGRFCKCDPPTSTTCH